MPQTLKSHSRMDAVQAPIVPVIGDLIRQVPGTISLGQGVVHYGPPPAAIEVARQALSNPETHGYQDGAGSHALVGAIEDKLRRDNGIDVERGSRVMVTAGGNMAFVHAVLAVTQPGDEVILPVPFYFNHEMAIQMAGCTAVLVPTDERYQLDLDAIRRAITPRTRAIVTVTPNNPTGAVYPEAALREVNALCRERGLYHITDEVYEYFTYGAARHVSPAAFGGAERHTISLFSLSKAYGFAGWRIGYMVYPDALASAIAKVQDTVLVCPPVISQVAAVAALEVGPAYCRLPAVLRRSARHRAGGIAIARADLHGAAGRRRVLLLHPRERRRRSDADRRAADPRAQGRGHSRSGVRDDRRLLLPRRVRRAAEGDGHRRHRPAGHRSARALS